MNFKRCSRWYFKMGKIFLLTTLLTGCFEFDEHRTLLLACPLNAKTTLEVYATGYGATSKDFTEIWMEGTSQNHMVKRIEGSYGGYKTEIFRTNDTLFSIAFTDTSGFKGMRKVFDFNINK